MILWPHPNRHCAVGRDLDVFAVLLRASHITQQTGLSCFHVRSPHLLLRFFRLRRGIGNVVFTIHFRPASKNHSLAVRRKLHCKDVLAVVTLIVCDLPCSKVWRIRNPDVALAFTVKDPGNAVGLCRRSQRRRERRTHHLFQSEAGCLRNRGNGKDQNEQRKSKEFHKADIIAARLA